MDQNRPNRLLWIFIGLSAVIHGALLMHFADLYRAKPLTYIEFTLKSISRPSPRAVPSPRPLPSQPEFVPEMSEVEDSHHTVPSPEAIRMQPVQDLLPHASLTDAGFSSVPAIPSTHVTKWQAGTTEPTTYHYVSDHQYLQLLGALIQKHLVYPRRAKKRHIDGVVVLRVYVSRDGKVNRTETLQSSGSDILDSAVRKAVRASAPFPPPPQLEEIDFIIDLPIQFDLERISPR